MNNNTKKKYMSFLDIETKNNKLNYDANKHNKIGIQNFKILIFLNKILYLKII